MLSLKDIFIKSFPLLLSGFFLTLMIATISFIISFLLGLMITLGNVFGGKSLSKILKIYISFFRGTPLLIQLFLFYYVLPDYIHTIKSVNKISALIFCMSLNYSAYMAEIFRGSIESVPKSQWEAAEAFCINKVQATSRIILPQALVSAIPPLTNSFMDLVKVSSIGMTIGVMDLMGRAQGLAATYYSASEIYIIAALMYWFISVVLGKIQVKLENKVNHIY